MNHIEVTPINMLLNNGGRTNYRRCWLDWKPKPVWLIRMDIGRRPVNYLWVFTLENSLRNSAKCVSVRLMDYEGSFIVLRLLSIHTKLSKDKGCPLRLLLQLDKSYRE